MKKAHFHLAILLLFFTNLTNAQYILTLDFEQMDAYIGKRLVTRVIETSTGNEVGRRTIDAVENSDFSFDLYVLLEGRSYTIDYYVDVNASGDYDAPPTDHAWRRSLNNATQHTTMTFIPDKNFTDTGLPDPFPYSTYDAVWGGKWHNLTFGSTDSIEGLFQLSCDSFYGYFTTAGVFGNPAQVEFDTSGVLPDDDGGDLDTIIIQLDPPWTGQITVFNGEIHADLMQSGIGLQFTGTLGAKQILALYTVIVAGNPFANGYFYLRELDINSSTPELMVALNANAEVTCFDGDDGFLSTEAIGGMPGYNYSWSNGDTTALISNLTAGDYSVTVTDILGCTGEMTYSVSQPEQIVITWFTDQVSCNGLCDGSIDIIMIGGVPPYFFSWSTGSTTEDIFDLCAGTYMPTVTDAVGCVASAPITIFEPDSLNVEVETTDVSCFGSCSGAIIHTVTGGVPPYNFMDQLDLCAGDYTTLVMDANGCLVSTPVTILEPDSFALNVFITPATAGQANGAIVLQAFGGIPPYQYSLNGGPYTASNIFINLVPGFYTPSIKDANGCIIEIEVFVPELTAVAELQAKYKLSPNPASSWINLESDIPLEIDVLDIHGQFIRHEEKAETHRIQVADFVPGVYLLRISDGVGMVYRKVIVL